MRVAPAGCTLPAPGLVCLLPHHKAILARRVDKCLTWVGNLDSECVGAGAPSSMPRLQGVTRGISGAGVFYTTRSAAGPPATRGTPGYSGVHEKVDVNDHSVSPSTVMDTIATSASFPWAPSLPLPSPPFPACHLHTSRRTSSTDTLDAIQAVCHVFQVNKFVVYGCIRLEVFPPRWQHLMFWCCGARQH